MSDFIAIIQKEFPNMESTIVFTRDPVSGQLFMNPLFKLPQGEDGQGFLLKQAELFQEYARALSHISNTFHKVKFKK